MRKYLEGLLESIEGAVPMEMQIWILLAIIVGIIVGALGFGLWAYFKVFS